MAEQLGADTGVLRMANTEIFEACTRALATPELLEDIILYLPPKNILLVQCMSRFWKASITESAKIQRVLFLRPVVEKQQDKLILWKKIERTNWPFGSWVSRDEPEKPVAPILNLLVQSLLITVFDDQLELLHFGFVAPMLDRTDYSNMMNCDDERTKTYVPAIDTIAHLDALHHKDASWQAMFLFQPPSVSVQFTCMSGDSRANYFDISNPDGVTMRNLLDGLRKHWFSHAACVEWTGEVKSWPTSHGLPPGGEDLVRHRDSGWSMLALFEKVVKRNFVGEEVAHEVADDDADEEADEAADEKVPDGVTDEQVPGGDSNGGSDESSGTEGTDESSND